MQQGGSAAPAPSPSKRAVQRTSLASSLPALAVQPGSGDEDGDGDRTPPRADGSAFNDMPMHDVEGEEDVPYDPETAMDEAYDPEVCGVGRRVCVLGGGQGGAKGGPLRLALGGWLHEGGGWRVGVAPSLLAFPVASKWGSNR